jgi:ABC-type nitrate/sulfonate/bicarbonate transport system ATPase subunit
LYGCFLGGFISGLRRAFHIHAQLLLCVWQKQRITVLLITPAADEAILFSDLL